MLDRAHRLTSPRQFEAAIRKGRRSGGSLVVVHLGQPGQPGEVGLPARLGLVVGRSVGNAVQRNRVKRRLRHVARERLSLLPDGSALVIRALPPSADAASAELGAALDKALSRLRVGER
jgi:ribonuclease P protein component